jgi:hypothetical protein
MFVIVVVVIIRVIGLQVGRAFRCKRCLREISLALVFNRVDILRDVAYVHVESSAVLVAR